MLLRGIEYFVEISKYKSISEASKKLYVSQQTLSSAMKNLERDLGFELLERSSSGVTLTKLGRSFLSDAAKVLNILNYWEHYSEMAAQAISGKVIVAGGSPLGSFMVELMTYLKENHPLIDVEFHEVASPEMPNYLRQKKARIGIGSISTAYSTRDLQNFAHECGFVMEQIGMSRLFLIVNKGNIICNEEYVSLGDCKHLNLAVRLDERPISEIDVTQIFRKIYHFNKVEDVIRFVSRTIDVAAFIPAIIYQEHVVSHYDNIAAVKLRDYGIPHPLFLFSPCPEDCKVEEKIVIDQIRDLENKRSYRNTV